MDVRLQDHCRECAGCRKRAISIPGQEYQPGQATAKSLGLIRFYRCMYYTYSRYCNLSGTLPSKVASIGRDRTTRGLPAEVRTGEDVPYRRTCLMPHALYSQGRIVSTVSTRHLGHLSVLGRLGVLRKSIHNISIYPSIYLSISLYICL